MFNTDFCGSKHMDKHDRPYKCTVSGCEKLRGFTYSGGLSRHEREVHKMGGTKKELFCKYLDCKRSSGVGFTRKENLAEHERRVHRTATRTSTSDLRDMLDSPDTQDEANAIEQPPKLEPSPQQRTIDFPEEGQPSAKRKRISDDGASENGETGLHAEVKRLRRENEEMKRQHEAKDMRLQQLEAAVRALQQQIQR